ncbi:MAG: glycosyltransferase family 4 protein [Kiritimatiellae bacterium]|nr:glycosyltransferase family 4 protein [Kiritimatiellia bacterium]
MRPSCAADGPGSNGRSGSGRSNSPPGSRRRSSSSSSRTASRFPRPSPAAASCASRVSPEPASAASSSNSSSCPASSACSRVPSRQPAAEKPKSAATISHLPSAPAYVAPPRLPCPVTLVLYDLHVFTHPQFCTRLNRLHYRWRIPASLRRADVVEVPSHHVLEQLRRLFPAAAGKAVVRPLALRERYGRPVTDAEKAAVRDKYGLPPRYLLFVGDPAPRKNLPAALEAWRALRADGEDIGFVIAGSPAARTQIGQPAPRQGLTPPPPVALGYVPDEEMPALYAGAAALLYPSFDEGYGLPIAEARACGCPVVTSAPTAREIAPDAFLCGADAASVTAALRAALGRVP